MRILGRLSAPIFAGLDLLGGQQRNHTRALAEVAFQRLLDGAHENVQIMAGGLDQGIFASDKVLPSFREALGRKVNIYLLCNQSVSGFAQPVFDLTREYKNFFIRQMPQTPSPHFAVADNRTVRIEDFHALGSAVRQSTTLLRTHFLADRLRESFEFTWKDAEPFVGATA